MTPQRLLERGIMPALAELSALGVKHAPTTARFLLAIALQESGLQHRRQVTSNGEEGGPAASFFQAEIGGACKGVLKHPLTEIRMTKLCDAYNVKPEPMALWEAIRYNDILASAMARLLVLTLPYVIPETAEDGWKQYLEAWRPGKPRPDEWAGYWAVASVTTGVPA